MVAAYHDDELDAWLVAQMAHTGACPQARSLVVVVPAWAVRLALVTIAETLGVGVVTWDRGGRLFRVASGTTIRVLSYLAQPETVRGLPVHAFYLHDGEYWRLHPDFYAALQQRVAVTAMERAT